MAKTYTIFSYFIFTKQYHYVAVLEFYCKVFVCVWRCFQNKERTLFMFQFLNRVHNTIFHFAKLISASRLLHPSLSHKNEFVTSVHPKLIVFYCISSSRIYWRWGAFLFLRHLTHCCIVSKDCSHFVHFELLYFFLLFLLISSLFISLFLSLTHWVIWKWGSCKILSGCT